MYVYIYILFIFIFISSFFIFKYETRLAYDVINFCVYIINNIYIYHIIYYILYIHMLNILFFPCFYHFDLNG